MKKKKLLVLLLVMMITLTGCTKQLTDKNKKVVVNETTGQSLTSNILCRPEDKKLLEQYKKYEKKMEVKLEDLPKCTKMKVYESKQYNGLWVGLFVRPLAWLIIKLGAVVKNYGLSVIIIGLLIRVILMPFSAKSVKQSEQLKKAQPEIARIEKKYEGKTDQDSMMKKSQETLMIYKKYDINPMSSCLVSLIQLPLFFAFLEAINRVPAIFENSFLSFQLGTTPLKGMQQGNYLYLLLIVLIVVSTALSFKFSMGSATGSEQAKQTKYMMIFMIVFIGIASIQLPSAIALYWIATTAFQVVQTIIMKKKEGK